MIDDTSFEFQSINIDELLLDQQNPRFDPVDSQQDAIQAVLDDQGQKIYNLAEDIAQHGLNPSTLFIVFKDKSKFIDGDGNRRLTALIILNDPERIRHYKLYAEFKALSQNSTTRKIQTVECVVFPNRDSMKHWLEINHGGESGGKGQISWMSEQKERFTKKKSVGLQAKELLLDKGMISIREFDLVNKSTLDRLLESKPGKSNISIQQLDEKFIFHDLDALHTIYMSLIGKSVKAVYHKQDRKKFLKDHLGTNQAIAGKAKDTDSQIPAFPEIVTPSPTPRLKISDEPIFGESLSLRSGLVNNLYHDITELYERCKESGNFIEILGVSMRLILDVAAREYFEQNPRTGLKADAMYNEYYKLIKKQINSSDENTLALDPAIINLIEETKVEALLAKLAHGNIRPSLSTIQNLSFIIGPILKTHFSKDSN